MGPECKTFRPAIKSWAILLDSRLSSYHHPHLEFTSLMVAQWSQWVHSTRASERGDRKFWPFWKRWPYFKVYFLVDLVHSHEKKGWLLGVLHVADEMMVVASICFLKWQGPASATSSSDILAHAPEKPTTPLLLLLNRWFKAVLWISLWCLVKINIHGDSVILKPWS